MPTSIVPYRARRRALETLFSLYVRNDTKKFNVPQRRVTKGVKSASSVDSESQRRRLTEAANNVGVRLQRANMSNRCLGLGSCHKRSFESTKRKIVAVPLYKVTDNARHALIGEIPDMTLTG